MEETVTHIDSCDVRVRAAIEPRRRAISIKKPVAVIDDYDPFRTALVELLGSLGYSARGFASAEEFLSGIGEQSVDCIITDLYMPGMSGFDLKRRLVAGGPTVPVIIVTGRAEPRLEAEAAAVGAVCLLRKPFDSGELIGCLERALETR